jgi:hypothetical protein
MIPYSMPSKKKAESSIARKPINGTQKRAAFDLLSATTESMRTNKAMEAAKISPPIMISSVGGTSYVNWLIKSCNI